MNTKTLLVIGLLAALTALVSSLLIVRQRADPDRRPKVAATIYPLYDIVRQVVGDRYQVVLIVPPGNSEHTYAPNPQTVGQLSRAQTVFAIGAGLDNWVGEVARNAGVPSVTTVDQGIDLISEGGNPDPHYWLSLIAAQKMAQTVADTMSQLDPEGKDWYQTNAAKYQAALNALYQDGKSQIQASGVTQIATFHQAWNYFARDYGLEVVATFEEYPGQEPSPDYLRQFQQAVTQHQLKVIYTEPQFNSQAITAIARDLGVKLKPLDPLGGTIDKDTYLLLLNYNINQVAAQ